MRGAQATASPTRSATAKPGAAPAVTANDPASARRRQAAVLAAAALPISMLAPWYSLRVSGRGLPSFSQQFSGWDEVSAAAIVCLIVAVGVSALIAVRAALRVSGLGADGRRAARARVDGALIAAAGLLCVVMLLWTAVAPPAVAPGAAAVSTHTSARWGVLLTLAFAGALTALGVQITAAAGRTLRDRRLKGKAIALVAPQPAPGRSTNENSALSTPTMSIPSTMSQRRRVM
jgi:hypothetical protein